MIRRKTELDRDRALLRARRRARSAGIGPNLMGKWFNGGGAAEPCSCDGWEPTDLDLAGFWDASYSTPTWSGTASAGSSGGRGLAASTMDFTHRPWTTGSTVNGYTAAASDGGRRAEITPLEAMKMAAAGSFSDYASAYALSYWFLVKPTTGPVGNTGGCLVDVINRSNGNYPMKVAITSGGSLFSLRAPGAGAVSCSAVGTVAMDDWNIICGRYNGAVMHVGLNEPPGTQPTGDQAYSSAVDLAADPLELGMETFVLHIQEQAFSGELLQIGFANRAMTDTEFCKVICKARSKFDLSLVPS